MGASYSIGKYVEPDINDTNINIQLNELKKKHKKQPVITPVTQPSTLIQHSKNIQSILKNTKEKSNNEFEFIENLIQLGIIQDHNNMRNNFMITDFKRKLNDQNKFIEDKKGIYFKYVNEQLNKENEIKFYNKTHGYLLVILIILIRDILTTTPPIFNSR